MLLLLLLGSIEIDDLGWVASLDFHICPNCRPAPAFLWVPVVVFAVVCGRLGGWDNGGTSEIMPVESLLLRLNIEEGPIHPPFDPFVEGIEAAVVAVVVLVLVEW